MQRMGIFHLLPPKDAMFPYSQDELNNHANQLNPNNDAYYQSRGFHGRPNDWDEWDEPLSAAADDDYFDNCDYEDWCSDDFD